MVEERFVARGGSYAVATLPDPWRWSTSVVGAPFPSLQFPCYRLRSEPMLASGTGVSSLPSACSSCWMMEMGAGLDESFSNKLDWSLDLLEDPVLFFFHVSHRGGGCRGEVRWSLRSTFRGRGSSPLALLVKLWRLLWLPAPSTLPVNLLAKWWPCEVMPSGHRHLIMLFLPASMLKGRQCFNSFESISSFSGKRRSGGAPAVPSGFVPGDDGCVLELLLLSRPDCNPRSLSRVLSACFRDLSVVSCFYLGLFVRCSVPPLDNE